MELVAHPDSCPNCKSNEIAPHKKYQIKAGAERQIFTALLVKATFQRQKIRFFLD